MGSRKKIQGFRRVANQVTICELLRLANDECQSDSEKDVRIRELLFQAMFYAKKMTAKLTSYKKYYDKGWWEKQTPEEKKRLNKIRTDAGYKCLE